MIPIQQIRKMSSDECMQGIRSSLLRSGVRTKDGFECVGEHATYNIRYCILLPYDRSLTTSSIQYRKISDNDWHSITECDVMFLRSLFVLVSREQYSRTVGMNAGIILEPRSSIVMELLAAGYDQVHAMRELDITINQYRRILRKLLAAWCCTTIPTMVVKYLLAQERSKTQDLISNPYDKEV